MQKKLQQILKELTEISGFSFALYRTPMEYVAGTFSEDFLDAEALQTWLAQDDPLLTEPEGCLAFPVYSVGETLFLMVAGTGEEAALCGKMAAKTLQVFYDSVRRELDRHSFGAALLAGEIPEGEVYKLAGRLKLKDVPRVLYLFELKQPLADASAIRMLTSLFADGKQDLLFLKDETHIVCIKSFEGDVTADQAKNYALTAVDTFQAELMIPTRVGYSTKKLNIAQLSDAHREASLALQISGIFQEQREVAAYSRLGIARLIHELPGQLCELFLHEVFGDQLPDRELDEEMQVTIRLFFENNLNVSETARRLFLHRNTLVYRLERLEKLVGLDIRKFEDAMTFQIAMMVLAHYRQLPTKS